MLRVLFKIGAGRKRSKTVGFETLNESSESSFLVGAVEKQAMISLQGMAEFLVISNIVCLFLSKK